MTSFPSQNWVCATAVVALVLTGCASHPVRHGGAEARVPVREEVSDPALRVVQALVDAFNRHDPAVECSSNTQP